MDNLAKTSTGISADTLDLRVFVSGDKTFWQWWVVGVKNV
ncbi:hypothetical protein DSCOOX_13730 [Desulfosarcina ovata subsp. ovata]|uniref:Uncharacterized protein n=2 Tax=Desulfosarcina ovata TaxID=83564 RepID=A0A5K8A6D5_9BACT|nr:hypothetical protein DSCOOX_13730 [Desulfosarcina ovata subsp. ovata]